MKRPRPPVDPMPGSLCLLCLCLMVWLFPVSCAREKHYVRGPFPPADTVALPETKTGEVREFYEVNGERYYPLPDAHGFVEFGKASWYGKEFQGRPTSSGEPFDMHKRSAAHKTLPLGTVVKVVNLSNDKHIIVPVNDRGPFVKDRAIDLSYAAAKEIGLIEPGVAEVKIVALGREVGETPPEKGAPRPLVELQDLTRGDFTIQVGSFQEEGNASGLADRLRVLFDYVKVSPYVDEKGRTFYRVHVSKSQTLQQAGDLEKRLKDMGFSDAFIVRMELHG
ncbi:MAG: septal ring lytic transglycosylase RlpA family protein [Deltaproteobacteria bacterium]|nr:septal ring lytic transglycosylase RlpA family protein [Deltaproteobacteria bacterium]